MGIGRAELFIEETAIQISRQTKVVCGEVDNTIVELSKGYPDARVNEFGVDAFQERDVQVGVFQHHVVVCINDFLVDATLFYVVLDTCHLRQEAFQSYQRRGFLSREIRLD